MGKVLKINLDSQSEIEQEGKKSNLSKTSSTSISVGKIKTNFFLPHLRWGYTKNQKFRAARQERPIL